MGRVEEVAERLGLSDKMDQIQFLATGFKAVDLEGIVPFENELQIFDLETHQKIRANWKAKLAKNPKLFPGPLATIKDYEVDGKVLKLRLQHSRFDIYDGLRDRIPRSLNLEQKPLDRDFCLPYPLA